MTRKPVSLTCHKSQLERSRRKTMRADMARCARDMASGQDVVAYAIVGLSADGRAFAAWNTGGALPMWAFPETVAAVLRADMDHGDEDFSKPIIDRAWRGSK